MASNGAPEINFIDTFAGCGGLSLGLMQAGLTGLFAIENDRFAFDTLQTNLIGHDTRYAFKWPRWLPKKPIGVKELLHDYGAELATLNGKVDVLVGGPPCQGFSSAGRRKYDDPRNQLFKAYLQLVELVRPRAVLIENVRGFTVDFDRGPQVINYAKKLRDKLDRDYEVYEDLLDLSHFGVPQLRTRYFLIALERSTVADDPFSLLADRTPAFLRSLGLRAPVASRAAISDLETGRAGKQPSSECPGFDEIGPPVPKTWYQNLMRDSAIEVSDRRLARHSQDIMLRFERIIAACHADGRLNTTINSELRALYGLKKRALRVLDPDRPSPTITSMPDDLLHYIEPRTLTVRENARLQSFPDWFVFKGKYTTGGHLRRKEVPRFTQVANAVPPLVARAIGELLFDLLQPVRLGKHPSKNSLVRSQRVMERPDLLAEG